MSGSIEKPNGERLRGMLLIASLSIGIFGFLQSWAVLPHRVASSEAAITKLQTETGKDREILIRIEERIKTLQEKLERKQ